MKTKIREDMKRGIRLTAAESKILGYVAEGHTNRDIAGILTISENTVKTHLRNIFRKLRLNNRSQATAYVLMCRYDHCIRETPRGLEIGPPRKKSSKRRIDGKKCM